MLCVSDLVHNDLLNIMSICNGSKKRNNKGNSSLSTAAVYPIIQTVQKEEGSDDVIDTSGTLPTTNGHRIKKPSSPKVSYGQKVEPQAVPYVVVFVVDIIMIGFSVKQRSSRR